MRVTRGKVHIPASRMRTRGNALLLAAASLLPAAPAAAQWIQQSPVPTHLDVRGVGAPTPAAGVRRHRRRLVRRRRRALRVDRRRGDLDPARRAVQPRRRPLNGIFFLDDQNGWAWGNANYRTTDGGTTWDGAAVPRLDLLHGVLHAELRPRDRATSARYVSPDGGLTWAPSPDDMFAFDFADDLTGLGVADTGLYRTTDGGATFALVHAGDAAAVAFLSATVAVAIVDGALRALDRRRRRPGPPALSADGRSRLVAVSADVVLAWGRSGTFPDYDDRIFRSADGGQTWTDLGEVMDPGVLAFAVPDAQTVVAADLAGKHVPLHRRRPDLDADLRLARPDPRLPEQRGARLRRRADRLLRLRRRLRHQDDRRRRQLGADFERLGPVPQRHGPLRRTAT